VLKGHIKYLEESAALSSIAVEFVAEAPCNPSRLAPGSPRRSQKAVQALIRSAQKVGTGLIWFTITWVPFLLPIGLIIYLIARGSKKRKAARKAAAVEQTQAEPKE
jgi:ATP-dependent Zn protease